MRFWRPLIPHLCFVKREHHIGMEQRKEREGKKEKKRKNLTGCQGLEEPEFHGILSLFQ